MIRVNCFNDVENYDDDSEEALMAPVPVIGDWERSQLGEYTRKFTLEDDEESIINKLITFKSMLNNLQNLYIQILNSNIEDRLFDLNINNIPEKKVKESLNRFYENLMEKLQMDNPYYIKCVVDKVNNIIKQNSNINANKCKIYTDLMENENSNLINEVKEKFSSFKLCKKQKLPDYDLYKHKYISCGKNYDNCYNFVLKNDYSNFFAKIRFPGENKSIQGLQHRLDDKINKNTYDIRMVLKVSSDELKKIKDKISKYAKNCKKLDLVIKSKFGLRANWITDDMYKDQIKELYAAPYAKIPSGFTTIEFCIEEPKKLLNFLKYMSEHKCFQDIYHCICKPLNSIISKKEDRCERFCFMEKMHNVLYKKEENNDNKTPGTNATTNIVFSGCMKHSFK